MTVAEIFREQPKHWDFRGDPFLWADLEQVFKEVKLPCNKEDFLKKLYLSIEEITGERLEAGEDIDVEMFDKGGLSSGKISYGFWVNIAIPILVDRLNKENKRIRDKYQYGSIIRFHGDR